MRSFSVYPKLYQYAISSPSTPYCHFQPFLTHPICPSEAQSPLAFLLSPRHAHSSSPHIQNPDHTPTQIPLIQSPHPSPRAFHTPPPSTTPPRTPFSPWKFKPASPLTPRYKPKPSPKLTYITLLPPTTHLQVQINASQTQTHC